ncbi:Hsp70 family protein [Azospirillum argentinense]
MSEFAFGIDFGTTNSLAAVHTGQDLRSFTHTDQRPHPSVVWYRGGEVIVGRAARAHLDAGTEAVTGSFVRSPKRLLASDAPVHVDGREIDPREVIAEVLGFLRADAASRKEGAFEIGRAVMTIPVDLDGYGRRRLREAARKAGIGVVQFVHEPLAALYAFLRDHPDYQGKRSSLDGKRFVVFDWGGGTLDLTLCLVCGDQLVQVANRGNNEIGGDRFDEVIRNRIRALHGAAHGVENVVAEEGTDSAVRLLTQCELAKIALASGEVESFRVLLRSYLRRQDAARDVNVPVTMQDLEDWTATLVSRGLREVDALLEAAGLTPDEVEVCLPTGGMVNFRPIRHGLVQRFGGRVARIANGDRIIAEGAALIAHDGLRLRLAKPVELLQPDGSYSPIIEAGLTLPIENTAFQTGQSLYYCVDPRDGVAVFEFARPTKVGYGSHTARRKTYASLRLKVDPFAAPFVERLRADITIDHDCIAHVALHSAGRGDRVSTEIYDLEFALGLTPAVGGTGDRAGGGMPAPDAPEPIAAGAPVGAVQTRSNVTGQHGDWRLVPGDIVPRYRPGFLDKRMGEHTERQRREATYYSRCGWCKRTAYEIERDGCDDCRGTITRRAAAERRRGLGISLSLE